VDFTIVVATSVLVGAFLAWSNGSNNAANLVGTVVGARVIPLSKALIIASVFEVVGAVAFGSYVSSTLSYGIVRITVLSDEAVVLGMLSVMLSSGLWVLTSSILKVPVSVIEVVVSCLVGFGLISLGVEGVNWLNLVMIFTSWFSLIPIATLVSATLFITIQPFLTNQKAQAVSSGLTMFILISTTAYMLLYSKVNDVYALLISIFAGFLTFLTIFHYGRKTLRSKTLASAEKFLELLASISIALVSISHGASNAGNVAGPLTIIFNYASTKANAFNLSLLGYLALAFSGFFMSLGILTWGKRVVGTIGEELVTLSFSSAFVVQVATSLTVLTFARFGIPVSTTMAIVGGITGVGLAMKYRTINFKTLTKLLLVWVLTLPSCVLLTAGVYLMLRTLVY